MNDLLMNDSFTFINLMGGLGNQLFQYAAGLLHKKHNNSILLLCKPHTNIHDTKDYRETVFKNENKYDGDLPHHVTLYQEDGYAFWNPLEWNYSILHLYGYFQNYETLKSIMPEFRDIILKNLEEFRTTMTKKYEVSSSSIFIHVRRGDYINHTLFPVQSIEYYKDCYKDCYKHLNVNKVFIFSDDLEYCKSQEFFQSLNPTYVDEDVINSLALMSEIRGGAIIANSTLSWMGAYLGCQLNNVYCPKKWITDNDKSINICPNEWIKV